MLRLLTWAGESEGDAEIGEAGTAGWKVPLSSLLLMLPLLPLRLTLRLTLLLPVSLGLPGKHR